MTRPNSFSGFHIWPKQMVAEPFLFHISYHWCLLVCHLYSLNYLLVKDSEKERLDRTKSFILPSSKFSGYKSSSDFVTNNTVSSVRHFEPFLRGLGVGMAVVSFTVGAYYTMVSGWALYYFFNSFQDPLPWSSCPIESTDYSFDNVTYTDIPMPVDECAKAGPGSKYMRHFHES